MGSSPQTGGFTARAERLLASVESAIDGVADDLDIDVLRAGNVITLTFENGHRMVVNSQEAAQEIWLAARSGGFHYRWDDGAQCWRDTRSDEDLRVVLSRLIELEVGVAPALGL
jgi:CyaY protein